jgi:hypothetical protein
VCTSGLARGNLYLGSCQTKGMVLCWLSRLAAFCWGIGGQVTAANEFLSDRQIRSSVTLTFGRVAVRGERNGCRNGYSGANGSRVTSELRMVWTAEGSDSITPCLPTIYPGLRLGHPALRPLLSEPLVLRIDLEDGSTHPIKPPNVTIKKIGERVIPYYLRDASREVGASPSSVAKVFSRKNGRR